TVRPFTTVRLQTFVPVPIVKDLQLAGVEFVGWLAPVKLASPMITSVVLVGTPFVQFDALFHNEEFVPFQDVCPFASTDANAASSSTIVTCRFMTPPVNERSFSQK